MEDEDRIRLVISDVDGTILNPAGELSPVNYVTAVRLRQAGIKLSLASARPPFGMGWLLHMLDIQCACAGLNGAIMFYPGGDVFAELSLNRAIVKEIAGVMQKRSVDPWLYTRERWFVPRLHGPYVRQSAELLRAEPGRYASVEEITDPILKMVGTTDNSEHLTACHAALDRDFSGLVVASSSQDHCLDVTHLTADKGRATAEIARREGVRLDTVLAIGDSDSDVPMFGRVGRSVAMGQADTHVKTAASLVTRSNGDNGFAWAVEYAICRKKFMSATADTQAKG